MGSNKTKAEFYVRQHQDNAVIAKLKSNIPLTEDDIAELQRIRKIIDQINANAAA